MELNVNIKLSQVVNSAGSMEVNMIKKNIQNMISSIKDNKKTILVIYVVTLNLAFILLVTLCLSLKNDVSDLRNEVSDLQTNIGTSHFGRTYSRNPTLFSRLDDLESKLNDLDDRLNK